MIDGVELARREKLFQQGYWEIPDNLDTNNFDFAWRPNPWDRPYTHQFGTQHQKTGGPRFVIPESEGIKYQSHQHAIRLPDLNNRCWRPLRTNVSMDYSWHPDDTEPPFIYVFGNQWFDVDLMPSMQYRVKGATAKKFMTDVKAILLPDTESRCWRPLVPNATIDMSWIPHPHDPPYIYVFGNQWYDVDTMPTYQYRMQGATEKKYVTDFKATLLDNKDTWLIPDYVTDFDYSWLPHPHDPPYDHQFPAEWHYTAGPKFISAKSRGLKDQTMLVAKTRVTDIVDTIEYTDSLLDALRTHKFNRPFVHIKHKNSTINPYELLKSSDSLMHIIDGMEAICSYRVPEMIYDKLYDYNDAIYHINGNKPKLLDIIFFSNGEACADKNYQRLLNMNLPNRIVRVDGVQGRVASQQAAAQASETEWYFLVNAKLQVDEQFDFNWQPDILKSRRHYIFRATNPVNGLVYGHMAIVANNKKLTMNTKGRGLDFTMESPHEIVDTNSGVAVYNSSAWDTWRTAFREVIKLCYAKDSESKNRLEIWSTVSDGEFAEYSIRGATDAIDYYAEVSGDFEKLKLSYDWVWLKERYAK